MPVHTLFTRLTVTAATILGVEAARIAALCFSSELMSAEALARMMAKGETLKSAYGWPLAFYWRYEVPPWLPNFHTDSRFSGMRLTADIAVWSTVLGGTSLLILSLLKPSRGITQWRPRRTTPVPLLGISALIVLANLSFDEAGNCAPARELSYGWPMSWLRQVTLGGDPLYREWYLSAGALLTDMILWALSLLLGMSASAWFIGRHRVRFRWSLRAMLAAVAVAGALCAWAVSLRNQARDQEALVTLLGENNIYFERRGPKWFHLFGLDRFSRRIIGARVDESASAARLDDLFERLSRMRGLVFLEINCGDGPFQFSHRMAAALGDMHRLRSLNVCCQGAQSGDSSSATRRCVMAMGRLAGIQRLTIAIWEDNIVDLRRLERLNDLRFLTLDVAPFDWNEYERGRCANYGSFAMMHLPAFPQLNELVLLIDELDDGGLSWLHRFPRLRSLHLARTSVTDGGLEHLAVLELLEELTINEEVATASAFRAIAEIKRLRVVHIDRRAGNYDEDARSREAEHWAGLTVTREPPRRSMARSVLTLDDHQELVVPPSELHGMRAAINELRNSHPGLVIYAVQTVGTTPELALPPGMDLN